MLRGSGSTPGILLMTGVFCAGCSAGGGDTAHGTRGEVGSGGAAGSAVDGGPALGAGGAAGTGQITLPEGGAVAADGADTCAATSQAAEKITITEEVIREVVRTKPVALYLMQDRSGSMLESTGIPFFSPSKWQQTVDAINAFSVDPSSDGIDVALGFFPVAGGLCTGENYDTPVVPTGRLLSPVQAQAISNALVSHSPTSSAGGGTPIEGGLRGAVNFCLVFEANHPDERCAVVLITDGAPTECSQESAVLSGVAAEAFAKAQVKTFAIGMNGADPALLNAIASAGQTDCSPNNGDNYCNVSTTATAFTDALKRIRETIVETIVETVPQIVTRPLDCEFKIPPAPAGQMFDLNQVNVRFSHDGAVDKILRVPSEADCAGFGNRGWYYDDPKMPAKIKVCPDTCADIKASTGDGGTTPPSATPPRVDILLGCKTEVAVH